MSDEIQVFTETFFISNESCVFTFDGCTLQWRGTSVCVNDFITVDYVHSGNCCTKEKSSSEFSLSGKIFPFRKSTKGFEGHDTIAVYYVVYQKKNKLRLCSIKFQGERKKLSEWLRMLRCALGKASEERPRSCLVFINPFSGRQNGVDLFNKKVKPIFDLAGVETCVVITQNRGDFEKVICSGVDCYDVILAVGGDGTVSEIVNCLISSQMDFSIPTMDEDVCVPKIGTPIAIIPCGSTDCVAYTLNGTRDPESNALYAILGYRSRFDVCQAISENGLNRYFVSVFTYGYLSDLIRESEKYRWMGPMRYNYAGLLTLLRSKEYYGQLDLTGEQCCRQPPPSAKKVVKTKSKTLSICSIPVVPSVEPGSEHLNQRGTCHSKKKETKCEAETPPACKDVIKKEGPISEILNAKVCEKPPMKCVPACEAKETGKEESTSPACSRKRACGQEEGKEGATPEGQGDGKAGGTSKCAGKEDGKAGGAQKDCDCLTVIIKPTAAACQKKKEICPSGEAGEGPKKEECCKKEDPCQASVNPCKDIIKKDTAQECMVAADKVDAGAEDCKADCGVRRRCIKGRYFLIACANISCSSELTPNGIAPHCVPGDGNMNVVLFQPNSICDLYRIYSRLTSKDRSFLLSDLPFVTIYKTNRVRVNVVQKDVDKRNAANCDGELFHDSVVDIRLHEDIVQFIRKAPCESE